MILTKTPLRISFAGGGSDYFHDNLNVNGKVVVTTINKYIYILLNNKYDKKVRVSYSKTENVNSSEKLKHQLIRETLNFFDRKKSLEIVTSADIPSSGSGLGSSSALVVGLVNALTGKKNKVEKKEIISKLACEIEINKCKKPIGYQDQYSTAFGGLNIIEFANNKKVLVKKILLKKDRETKFKKNLLLFYTGINRKADKILTKISNTKVQINNHAKLALLASDFQYELINGDLINCGKILHENWIIKRNLNKSVSSLKIDEIYDIAIKNGAVGGKLLGAGGGGYFLFYVPENNQKKIINKLKFLQHIPFEFETLGTQKFKI